MTPHDDLYVHCEDLQSCSAAVGMLVVEDATASEPERCTASLIGPDLALTASHCLLAEQRHDGSACEGVFILFPKTTDAPQEQVACNHVVSARGGALQDGLHSEHALLRLARRLERRAFTLDPTPLAADQIVTVVSVTPHPVYGSTHSLTSRLCRTAGPEQAEQALGPAAANVGWLSDCPIERGNSGSPVLDYQGRLRAIVHGGTSTSSAFAVTSAPPRS
jgi:hypothetical protein